LKPQTLLVFTQPGWPPPHLLNQTSLALALLRPLIRVISLAVPFATLKVKIGIRANVLARCIHVRAAHDLTPGQGLFALVQRAAVAEFADTVGHEGRCERGWGKCGREEVHELLGFENMDDD